MKETIIEKSKINMLLIKILMVFTILILIIGGLTIDSRLVTNSISDQVIRFHVVANSDTVEDQLLKQRVKDEVIDFMQPLIKKCNSVDDTREVIKANLPKIKKVAEQVVIDSQKDYDIYVALDKANFPIKKYGDILFPAGEYEACRVVIGEGKGENWWCVMYPPLCYVDAASGVVPLEGKEALKKELNEEQYNLVANQKEIRYEVRFKIIDTINSIFCKSNYKDKR